MATTIFRTEKVKSKEALRKFGAHVMRFQKTPNADARLYKNNRVLIGSKNPAKDMDELFKKARIKPRKDAVLAQDVLLTLSPEIFGDWKRDPNSESVRRFEEAATDWLLRSYGKARVVHVSLHLDETTPHIHALVAPICKRTTDDGSPSYTLRARDLFSPSRLGQMQRTYFERMSQAFPDLVPPEHGRQITHQKVKAFYNDIQEDLEKAKETVAKQREHQYARERDKLLDIWEQAREMTNQLVKSKTEKIAEDLNIKEDHLKNRINLFLQVNKLDLGREAELVKEMLWREADIVFDPDKEIDVRRDKRMKQEMGKILEGVSLKELGF